MLDQVLSKQRRERVRTIARDAYLYARCDQSKAKQLATERIKAEFVAGGIISAIAMKLIIAVAINLASKLIARWVAKRLSTPTLGYVADEPGYSE